MFQPRSFFNADDRFADFYNPAYYAMDRELVSDKVTNSPPFLHFCGYIANKVICLLWPDFLQRYNGAFGLFGRSSEGTMFWLSIVAAAAVCLGWCCGRLLRVGFWRGLLVAVFAAVLSYPFLYTVDRGNYVLFVAVLLAAFAADYEEHPYRAAVWLALAAALKLYPALLGILFLRDKRWKAAGLCAGTGAGLTLLSFGFFSTGGSGFWVTVQDWLQKVQAYNSLGNNYEQEARAIHELLLNNSMRTPAFFVQFLRNPEGGLAEMISSTAWMGVASLLLLAAVLLLCLYLPKMHDVVLLCSLMMILYPMNSGIYNLALLVVPLLVWSQREPEDFWVPTLGFVLLLAKTAVYYGVVTPGAIMTMQGLLSAPLMLAMTGYILWLRRAVWMSGLRDTLRKVREACRPRAAR